MSDLKAASCNECALVLERLQGYHSFDVFGRFFKLCNQLHINGELPKRLLNDIPDWPSWTTLEMRFRDHWKTENCHSLQATPPAEVMSEWLSDVKHLCQQGYNSPGHLPIALHSAGSDRQAVIPPHIRAKVSALFARTVEGFHGSTSPAQDNQGKSPRSPSIPTSLQALSRNRVSIILENPSDGSYFIDNFKITTRKNASRIDKMEEDGSLQFVGTVPRGRLGLLLNFCPPNEQKTIIGKVKKWINQAQAIPQKSTLSLQVLHDIQAATATKLCIGETPLTAPSCFRSCWNNATDKEGWMEREDDQEDVLVLLPTLGSDSQMAVSQWILTKDPHNWFLVTNEQTQIPPDLKSIAGKSADLNIEAPILKKH